MDIGGARIDLNADLGEGVTDDDALLGLVTSASVACGFHAGDADTMAAVCARAARCGVAIGAQVSYADRDGFGRRRMDVPSETLRRWVAEQVAALAEAAAAAGTAVTYVKPHGALYNRIVDDPEQAAAVLDGSGDLPVLGLPDGVFLAVARSRGRTACGEGFPDRGYTGVGPGVGRLVPRDSPGALVEDPAEVAANAVRLARVRAVGSVCVHGDSPGAVHNATRVRDALVRAGFTLSARFPPPPMSTR